MTQQQAGTSKLTRGSSPSFLFQAVFKNSKLCPQFRKDPSIYKLLKKAWNKKLWSCRERQWSSSSRRMDNNVNNSRSNEKQPLVGSKVTSEEKKPTESVSTFVNQAEIAWHERRNEWAGDLSQKSSTMPKDPILSWSLTYDDLLLTNDPFPQPIPLTEMVDFLVDIWHEEGLFD